MAFLKKILNILLFAVIVVFLASICFILLIFLLLFIFSMDLPDHKQLQNYSPNLVTRVFSADGKLIAEYAIEKRIFVPIQCIPAKLKNAFLAAEDKNFYQHMGIDIIGMIRAMLTNIINAGHSKRLVGASTITQQVAKVFFTGNKLSYMRKIKEAILAFRLEHTLGKNKILELYLNQIYLGNCSYGVAIAAKNYFDKSLEELTIAECSYLAALAKGANNYHPIKNKQHAIKRRNWVIDKQLNAGLITNREAVEARTSDLTTNLNSNKNSDLQESYFVEEVRKTLAKTFSSNELYKGGLVVRTTQDTTVQNMAEEALKNGLLKFEQHNIKYNGPVANIFPNFEKIKNFTYNSNSNVSYAVVTKVSSNQIIVHLNNKIEPSVVYFKNFSWIIRQKILETLQIGLVISFKKNPSGQLVFDGIVKDKNGRNLNAKNHHNIMNEISKFTDSTIGVITGISHKRVSCSLSNNTTITLSIQEFYKLFEEEILKKIKIGDVVLLQKKNELWTLIQKPEIQGAILVMNPLNGQVLAIHGGFDFKFSEFNRSIQAKPQIGSLIKPFIYLAALEKGMCPATKINAKYVALDLGTSGIWEPKNSGMGIFKEVSMRDALEKSINTATVRVASFAGLEKITQIIKKFGILDEVPTNISFILGACNSTLIEIATAYSMIANGGKKIDPSIIDIVQNKYGKIIYKSSYHICSGCLKDPKNTKVPPTIIDTQQQLINPATIYQLQNMLEGVISRGSGKRAKNIHYSIAGKTGTSNDNKAVWFVGFTPDIVVVVFVGYDNNKDLGYYASGSSIALPIFMNFINNYIKGKKPRPFNVPSNISLKKIFVNDNDFIIEVFKDNDSIDFKPEPDLANFKEIDVDFDYTVRKFKRLYR